MAETTGIVQRLNVIPGAATACIWIGPTPVNTELLFVQAQAGDSAAIAAFQGSIVDALGAAVVSRREVVAVHADDSARVTSLRIEPA
jgi:hypothetical protein